MDESSAFAEPLPGGTTAGVRSRVGRWSFDRSANTLTDADASVRIEPKVADLLQALIERHDTVVSREQLLAAVWPGVVVGDEALTQSVNKLRRALGDTSREATFIQTVPKRGYRLIAEVASEPGEAVVAEPGESGEPESHESTSTVAALTPPSRWFSRRVLATLLAFAVVAAVAGWLVVRSAGGDDLAAILARAAPPAGPAQPLPEVVVRRFQAIGPQDQAGDLARAFWMQVVAGVSQSARLRVIAEDTSTAPGAREPMQAHRYQVDGTVRTLEDQLAIHLVLSNAASHVVVWTGKFDIPLADLSRGRDLATPEVLNALSVKLSESERARISRPYTQSPRAFQHFLAGQAAFGARDPLSNVAAAEHYRLALSEDPAFARALAGLALTNAAEAAFGWGADRQAASARAIEYAQRAQSLEPDLADVHWVLGWVQAQRREHARALHHARRALELNPSHADAYALAAAIATYIGRPADALVLMGTAARLKPNPGFLYSLVLGRANFFLGDDAQAIANLHASAKANPAFLESRVYLAAALARSGRVEDARWEIEEIRAQSPAFSAREWIGASLLTDRGAIEQLTAALAAR